jgi:hypothetical protein
MILKGIVKTIKDHNKKSPDNVKQNEINYLYPEKFMTEKS